MKKRNKLFLATIIAVTLIGIIGIFFQPKKQDIENKQVIRIGAILPLTGDFGNIGQSFKNAVLLAKKDLEKKNLKNKYEFIFDDDSFETRKTISAFQKQRSLDKVKAVISFASATGNVIAPLTDQAKIIYINVGASDKNVAKGKYNFIHWTQPENTAGKLAEFLSKNNYKNIAFIGGIDAGVNAIGKSFIEQATPFGLNVKVYNFNNGEKNFKLLLLKTQQDNPDAYVVMAWGGTIAPMMKQIKEVGITQPITNIEIFATVPDFSVVNNTYYSDVAQSSPEFIERLKKEFPDTASDFGVGNIYDSIILFVQAFEKASTPDEAVDELIKTKTYNGVVGNLIQDEAGIFNSQAIIKKVINNKPELIKE